MERGAVGGELVSPQVVSIYFYFNGVLADELPTYGQVANWWVAKQPLGNQRRFVIPEISNRES